MASIEDFKKIEIRIGEILSVQAVPDSEKLLKLAVSFGSLGERQIIAGIKTYFSDPTFLVGKKCSFVFNLETRTIFGLESQGMILCASEGEKFSLLEAQADIPAGSLVK
jgi:methionyl-tRNA synthetase